MNPFMASPMFAVPHHPAYANQYAAAALAAVASQHHHHQQQHQHQQRFHSPSQLQVGCLRMAPLMGAGQPAVSAGELKQQANCAALPGTPTTTVAPLTVGSLKRSPDAFEGGQEEESSDDCDTRDQDKVDPVPLKRQRLETDGSHESTVVRPSQPERAGAICDKLQSIKAESATSADGSVKSTTPDSEPVASRPAIGDHRHAQGEKDKLSSSSSSFSSSSCSSPPLVNGQPGDGQPQTNGKWRPRARLFIARRPLTGGGRNSIRTGLVRARSI